MQRRLTFSSLAQVNTQKLDPSKAAISKRKASTDSPLWHTNRMRLQVNEATKHTSNLVEYNASGFIRKKKRPDIDTVVDLVDDSITDGLATNSSKHEFLLSSRLDSLRPTSISANGRRGSLPDSMDSMGVKRPLLRFTKRTHSSPPDLVNKKRKDKMQLSDDDNPEDIFEEKEVLNRSSVTVNNCHIILDDAGDSMDVKGENEVSKSGQTLVSVENKENTRNLATVQEKQYRQMHLSTKPGFLSIKRNLHVSKSLNNLDFTFGTRISKEKQTANRQTEEVCKKDILECEKKGSKPNCAAIFRSKSSQAVKKEAHKEFSPARHISCSRTSTYRTLSKFLILFQFACAYIPNDTTFTEIRMFAPLIFIL